MTSGLADGESGAAGMAAFAAPKPISELASSAVAKTVFM
jgi:hypothetical protein